MSHFVKRKVESTFQTPNGRTWFYRLACVWAVACVVIVVFRAENWHEVLIRIAALLLLTLVVCVLLLTPYRPIDQSEKDNQRS